MRVVSPIRSGRDLVFGLLSAIALAWGLFQAASLRWVCDDAFITFRYVDNLLAGRGLVFNAGERVEGYTHFLWVWPLAACRLLGLDLAGASQFLGLLAYALLLGLSIRISRRLFPDRRPLVPFLALCLAFHYEMNVWATGGLETMLYTFEILLAFYFLALLPGSGNTRLALAGSALVLATLTRPDAVLFDATFGGFLLCRRPPRRALLAFFVPFLALVPYAVWKLAYYGDLLPNPYYAKSGGLSYYSQGFRYVGLYLRAYPSSLLALAAAPLALGLSRRSSSGNAPLRLNALIRDPEAGSMLLALVSILVYALLFVARVGGDFMYGRFLVPVLPLMYLLLEMSIVRLLRRRERLAAAVLLAFPLVLLGERRLRHDLYFQPDGAPRSAFGIDGIADEHWYYTHRVQGLTLIDAFRLMGEGLSSIFGDNDVRVLLRGQAALGYYGRFPVCIEDSGLTDRMIARLPVHARGRPGHEKSAPLSYLEERDVHFVFQKPPYLDRPYRAIRFLVEGQPVRGEILSYDRDLMRALKARGGDDVVFTDFEQWLDEWIRALPGMDPAQARRDLAEFDAYYFRHNRDEVRRNRILSLLGGAAAGSASPPAGR